MVYVRHTRKGRECWPLANILLAHICWSTNPSTGLRYEKEDLHRGPWAGDRFDVCLLSTLQEEMTKGVAKASEDGVDPEKTWVDVTQQVNDHMDEIWACEDE